MLIIIIQILAAALVRFHDFAPSVPASLGTSLREYVPSEAKTEGAMGFLGRVDMDNDAVLRCSRREGTFHQGVLEM